MRLAYITQYFPPEPSDISLQIGLALSAMGELKVLTSNPNYPTGELYFGYEENTYMEETVCELPVSRVPIFPSHDASALNRVRNYLSFAKNIYKHQRKILRNSDLVFVYGSPITATIPAYLAKKMYGTPYVVMVQDLWPDSIYATGFLPTTRGNLILRELISFAVRRFYSNASHLIAISARMKKELLSRGYSESNVSLVYNWANSKGEKFDDTDLRNEISIRDDVCLIMYAGNMGPAQDLTNLLAAMAVLKDTAQIHLLLLGDGIERIKIENFIRDRNLQNVTLKLPVSLDTADAYMKQSDICIVSLRDDPLFELTFPSKVQRILSLGRPILGILNGEVADIITEMELGWTCAPGDPIKLAEVLEQISLATKQDLATFGINSEKYFEKNLSSYVNIDRLSTVLSKVLDSQNKVGNDSKIGF